MNFGLSFGLRAQDKFEREYRLKPALVPVKAQEFIKKMAPKARIKWFKEESHQGISIEAKFRDQKRKYSVEFDSSGNLQDIEWIVKFKNLSPSFQKQLEKNLAVLYDTWKLRKIQLQYKGLPSAILQNLHQQQPSSEVQVAYEIVLKAKAASLIELYEITFDTQGTVQHIQKIRQQKADHLEY